MRPLKSGVSVAAEAGVDDGAAAESAVETGVDDGMAAESWFLVPPTVVSAPSVA